MDNRNQCTTNQPASRHIECKGRGVNRFNDTMPITSRVAMLLLSAVAVDVKRRAQLQQMEIPQWLMMSKVMGNAERRKGKCLCCDVVVVVISLIHQLAGIEMRAAFYRQRPRKVQFARFVMLHIKTHFESLKRFLLWVLKGLTKNDLLLLIALLREARKGQQTSLSWCVATAAASKAHTILLANYWFAVHNSVL